MMKGCIQLISFDEANIQKILNLLDIRTKIIEKTEVLLKTDNQVARCEVCKKELTMDNLGNIAKGSRLLFCDNSACFTKHLADKNY